jgi:IclR family KDG regulon transcriptional repressor
VASSEPKTPKAQDGAAVKTVAKVLDLLEHVAAAGRPLTVSELAASTGFNVSTAHRLMQTLVSRNYVEQSATSRAYSLGPRLLELGVAYSGSLDLTGAARPRIEALRDLAGETVHVAILAGRDVVEICAAGGRQAVTVSRGAGRRDPAHCTATGKILLAALPEIEIDRFLAQGPLHPATPRSICDADAFRAELARARSAGYAIDEEELSSDVCCIGVAIRDGAGRAIAAVSVAIPKARFRGGDLTRWVGMLNDTSRQISRALVLSGDA